MLRRLFQAYLILLLSITPLLYGKSNDHYTAEIPHEIYTLPNGLRVVMHEDHRSPIASIFIVYKVGSKNEKVGRRGFAHLFEHLMFNGSEHFNNDFFKAIESIGATDVNGSTSRDFTVYHETFPIKAMDTVLWIESDRMRNLLGALDQAKLDEQRKVVLNEKKQRMGQPYGILYSVLAPSTYPEGHPYSWSTIGEDEDLNQANLEDVRTWFRTYYGAANTVIGLSGDFKIADAKKLFDKYFGAVASGQPMSTPPIETAHNTENTTQHLKDHVPTRRLYVTWNVPADPSLDILTLNSTSDILSWGNSSRLYQRLVEKEKLVSSISASIWPGVISSYFIIDAMLSPQASFDRVEQVINEELNKLMKDGPTKRELEKVKTQYQISVLNSLDNNMSKARTLATNLAQYDDPNYHVKEIKRVQALSKKDIQQKMEQWLTSGRNTMKLDTLPDIQKAETVDRSALPKVGDPKLIDFPQPQEFTLKDGTPVQLIQSPQSPFIRAQWISIGGFMNDPVGKRGLTNVLSDVLNMGTAKVDAKNWNERLLSQGINLSFSSSQEHTYAHVLVLKDKFHEAASNLLEVLNHPRFTKENLTLSVMNLKDALAQSNTVPASIAFKTLQRYAYPQSSPYSWEPDGLHNLQELEAIQIKDLEEQFSKMFTSQNSKLIVVGDVSPEQIQSAFDKRSQNPQQNLTKLVTPPKSMDQTAYGKILFVHRPSTPQSYLIVAGPAPDKKAQENAAAVYYHMMLGGVFTSRINMNLREDKGWSYGVKTMFLNVRGPRAFVVRGSVQIDKTVPALQEIYKELEAIHQKRPFEEAEFQKVRLSLLNQLPAWVETNESLLGQLSDVYTQDLPKGYLDKFVHEIDQMTLTKVQSLANEWISPQNRFTVVVGDRAKILNDLKKIGDVVEVDAQSLQELN